MAAAREFNIIKWLDAIGDLTTSQAQAKNIKQNKPRRRQYSTAPRDHALSFFPGWPSGRVLWITGQRVPFTINGAVLPVVKRFAGKVGKRVNQYRRERDIAIADKLGADRFRIPTNCDFRGRLFGVSDFNFQREDHVRSLFRFAQGMPIGDDGLYWLMIHTANCGDFERVSKRPFHERIRWVEDHREQITRAAQDPNDNKWWKEADAPFSFVAACIELAGAWKAGPRFITTLPVCFDGSCSGIQHLSLTIGDEEAGRLVNLIPGDEVQDIYQVITDRVVKRLEAADDEKAGWWLRRGVTRKLVKRGAMTFAYSATIPGMQEQLDEVYAELFDDGRPDTFYLANHIWHAAKEALPGPIRAMKFIRKLAKERAAEGKVLEWTTPSGFPWSNRYHESNTKTLHLTSGVYFRCKVATTHKPELLKRKVLNAAAPNFTHALDAAHLIRVVNAAARTGITDIVVVHDSYGCLAPLARAFNNVIRSELARLYRDHDVLDELRQAAGSTEPLPDRGRLNPWDVCHSQYAFA